MGRTVGPTPAKDVLPSELGRRVIGSTYTPENLKYFDAWPRGRQVTSDVQRRQPANWLAIDDARLADRFADAPRPDKWCNGDKS